MSPMEAIVTSGRRVARQRLGIMRVHPLLGEQGRHAAAPDVFDRGENPRLVVDQHVMVCRVAAFDVVELLFLVDVDQHVAVDRVPDARLLGFAGLEDDVAVGEDHRRGVGLEAFEDFQGAGVEDFGERVVDQPEREGQQLHFVRVFDSVLLQCPQVVAVAERVEQAFEDRPIAVARAGAEFAFDILFDVGLNAVVVEQRVVDVDEEDDGGLCRA